MNVENYFFESQGVIFAYRNDEVIGMLVVYAGETFEKGELLDFFETDVTHMIAAELPDIQGEINAENYAEKLQDIIAGARDGDFSDIPIKYHIPKYWH